MRETFSDCLVKLAKMDRKVVLLTGDHGYSLFDKFRDQCSEQYLNAGIAEQNMVGMAAGLARTGYKPIVYGLSAFIPIRVLEQIKLDVAHDNLPVIFVGDGAGFVYGHLGTSHQSTEDIACLRSLPKMSIYSPADRFELISCIDAAYLNSGPVYIRFCKSDLGDIHEKIPNDINNLLTIKYSNKGDIFLLASGSMLKTACEIENIETRVAAVLSVPKLKPFNSKQLIELINKAGAKFLVVLEEHSIFGGLGSIVSEICAEVGNFKVLRVGVNDRFSHKCGSYNYLLKEHNLDLHSVLERINKFVN